MCLTEHRFLLVVLALVGTVVTCSSKAAGPVDVILEVELLPPVAPGEFLDNVVSLYGSQFGGALAAEQYFTSLQARFSGHMRLRIDPENPESIEFRPGSYLTLSTGDTAVLSTITEDSLAYPGGTPANLAGQSSANPNFKAALRNTTFEFVSTAMPITPSDEYASLFVYDPQPISAKILTSSLSYQNAPFIGTGTLNLSGTSLNNNQTGNPATLLWDPNEGAAGYFDFYFVYSAAPIFSFIFSGFVQMSGDFSLDNYASVESSGQEIEVLGGANSPGGVSAIINGVATPGNFSAQQIGPNGLPFGAPEEALAIPDLANALTLGANPQIWELGFTGEAEMFEVTIGYSDILLPALVNEESLVLYHYTQEGWIAVDGQVLNVADNTIYFTTTDLSPFMLGMQPVPEPASFIMSAIGLIGTIWLATRRRKP